MGLVIDDLTAGLTAVAVVVLAAGLPAVAGLAAEAGLAAVTGFVCAFTATNIIKLKIPNKIFFMYCVLSLSAVAGYLNELFIERIIVAFAFDGLHFFLYLFSHLHFECNDFLFQHFAVGRKN